MRYYTGIGSRQTPENVLKQMTQAAGILETGGYVLRSGGAEGADSAFEAGVRDNTYKEIYLPWPKFNGNQSILTAPSVDAMAMAAVFHPRWEKLSQGAKKLQARNCHQVLGMTLEVPSDFIICWTPSGHVIGGTGQALRLAKHYNVPVINLGNVEGNVALLKLLFPV